MGGMVAGLLRLDLSADPLSSWIKRTAEAAGTTVEEMEESAYGAVNGDDDDVEEVRERACPALCGTVLCCAGPGRQWHIWPEPESRVPPPAWPLRPRSKPIYCLRLLASATLRTAAQPAVLGCVLTPRPALAQITIE